MKIKGVLISLLVLVISLGFLATEKASASVSVSSNLVNEVGDRIDTSKNYYIVPADSPTKGLRFFLLPNSLLPVLLSPVGGTIEKPLANPVKLHFSEDSKKYRVEMFVNIMGRSASYWFHSTGGSVKFIGSEKDIVDWTITPVEGGYTFQAEGGYLYYEDVISPMNGPLTCTYLGKKEVVWKLVPAS
ncbi:hypothetical protein [Bacillus pseudomycoides]|uniref:hypothetical protein n=1 Tax=Bacillus pseudomycoides TaxID=64104 RepID=UPI000BEBEB03|nr:hypothetical protein [Bacillus pseudomycoides]MEB3057435.1 hypothetical protein [Bacillus pseudomycoides]PEB40261.1 hypothetical protein COO06_18555 [Bacillus pseudomycoides]PGE01497.1 hypothetical protein COM50_05470 [Bacillus pseudomycoides]PGE05506.1 hypothetical protein COM49_03810 [Bacillus pseudomycoides]PGE94465.1 hypothetical protein COM62_23950 [Bacillus pseudomycoides]